MIGVRRVSGFALRGGVAGLLSGLAAFALVTLATGASGNDPSAAEGTVGEGWAGRWSVVARLGMHFATGYGAGGLLLGALFGLVFAGLDGRVGAAGPRATAACLALAGLVVLDLVPALLAPPWPPGLLDAHQAALGAELRVALTLFSLAAAVVALAVRAQLPPSWPDIAAAAFALLSYGLAMGLVGLGLRAPVPAGADGLSAAALWRFRAATFGGHAVLWIGLGLGVGLMVERALRPRAQALARRATA